MRYREGQVGCYGKKGLIFLGIMEIRWKVVGEISGFEYSFVGYVIKGYSGQDNLQVADIIQLAVDTVQDHDTAAKRSSFSQIMQVVFPHNN